MERTGKRLPLKCVSPLLDSLVDTHTKRGAGPHPRPEVLSEAIDYGEYLQSPSRAEFEVVAVLFEEESTRDHRAREIRGAGEDGIEREQHHSLPKERQHGECGEREAVAQDRKACFPRI